MKKNLLSIALISVLIIKTDGVFAQQDPYNTHYAFNRMMYNPAVAGAIPRKYCLSVLSHHQYLGYEDRTPEFWPSDPNNAQSKNGVAAKGMGPKTQYFSFNGPVTQYGGLGIAFMNDKLGYESSTHIKLDAAGRIPLANEASISVGFEVNFLTKGIDGAQLKALAPNDPKIPTTQVSDMHPVFGAGVYYRNPLEDDLSWRDLWGGISALNINKPQYNYGGTMFSTPQMHTYIMAGITRLAFLGNSDLKFHPSVMIKQNAVWQLDATALVEYQEKLWGGLAYRTTADALSVMLGYSGFGGNFRGLRVGYSYDLTLTKILSVSSGTHELQLNYCFEIKLPPPPIRVIVTPPFMHRDSD